jgi:endonuclease YncB( thermonuclease family)
MAKVGIAVALVVGLVGAGLVGALPVNAEASEDQVVNGSSDAGIMINEVEMNPKGRDSGKEWVELYNPTSSDVNIGDFAIQTLSKPFKVTIPAGTIIGTGQLYVVKVNGERFAIADTLTLVDASGRTVDRTPSLLDRRDDARSWQRIPDGASTWRFVQSTQGEPNDPATFRKAEERSVTPAQSSSQASTSSLQCMGAALCLQGKVFRMVDTDTLYVRTSSGDYKVDLSLTKVSRSDKNYESGSRITKYLCLGSDVLVDQDDGQAKDKGKSIIGVVYCSSQNLNQQLLDSGFVGLDYRGCFVSEFGSQDWAVRNGCR